MSHVEENLNQVREDLYSFISDASKDAYGSRVRFDCQQYTVVQLEMIVDEMVEAVGHAIELEKEQEAKAVHEFEDYMDRLITQYGAADRLTALRWVWQAIDPMDLGEVEWTYGLPYGYLDEFKGKERWLIKSNAAA